MSHMLQGGISTCSCAQIFGSNNSSDGSQTGCFWDWSRTCYSRVRSSGFSAQLGTYLGKASLLAVPAGCFDCKTRDGLDLECQEVVRSSSNSSR